MEDTPVPDQPPGPDEVAAGVAAPAMPIVPRSTLWRGGPPYLIPAGPGQRYGLGWHDTRKNGPCFVVARTGPMGGKVLDRFPLTAEGWAQAWAALVKLDAGEAEVVAQSVQELLAAEATHAAETARQAQLYEAFANAGGPTVFRMLGVQVLVGDGKVYTIGSYDPEEKTNASRLLGLLAGAQAMVTDGAQAWSPGRAMFLPISLAGLATKTKAYGAIVFPDGTAHTVPLDGNYMVREAQKQVVEFNALASAAIPAARQTASDPADRLRKLGELRDAGLLSQEEYESKRTEIINSI